MLTHFYHDEELKEHSNRESKKWGATQEYDGLSLFSCGEHGPEGVDVFFIRTHNHYCKQLYNILCDYIDAEIEVGDPFRYGLSLRRDGLHEGRITLGMENLHPRWDFDKYTDIRDKFVSNSIYQKFTKVREDEFQQLCCEIKKRQRRNHDE